eukprot:GFUD01023957.1.p1 GENE.GFUD01023957.1~~GFUD01023957.1.p1  ORF type:complete len:143 (+),score=19.53 GFUD01023957.1:49-477(+)
MEKSQCSVCDMEIPKSRLHYGGISCYSCRAFFRRMTQKADLNKCRFDRKCYIGFRDRKSCPPCRYEKCLRIGMRPDLVLDEGEKKKRPNFDQIYLLIASLMTIVGFQIQTKLDIRPNYPWNDQWNDGWNGRWNDRWNYRWND